jgi:hypothetical protein
MADGAQRIEHAELQVVVHRQIVIGRVRVAPRQHVHRVPLCHQVAHQRVVRRQVEDVELHDPRRHDEHRLGVHGLRLRRIADQLDQPVMEHHLARRRRQVAADGKARGLGLLRRVGLAGGIAPAVNRALHLVCAGAVDQVLQHHRVGRQRVGRRQQTQPLPRKELRLLRVVRGHARHVCGLAPERLLVAETVAQRVERPLRPRRMAKARVVVGVACGLVLALGAECHAQAVVAELRGQRRQLHLPARRQRQMPGPIGPGQRQRHGRQATRQRRGGGVEQAIEALRGRFVVHERILGSRIVRALIQAKFATRNRP